jgi:RNA recognition motif-containing protein
MAKKLFVGNLTNGKLYVSHLPTVITNRDLEKLFLPHGHVRSAEVTMDPVTGKSKGYGFVQMGSEKEVCSAIAALSGREMDGRKLKVTEANK